MERYLRKGLTNLYRWVLMALAETAAVTPWLVLLYRAADAHDWARALPGSWLLILTFLGGALWEAGRPRTDDRQKQEFRSRLIGLAVGSVLFYLLGYAAMPGDLQTGVLHGNLAWATVPAIWYLWYQATETVATGLEYGRVFGRFTTQAVVMVLGVIVVVMAGLTHEPRIQVMLYWDVFMLFGAGLTLLLVARERSLRKGQAALGEEGGGSALSSRKLTILVAVLLGLTIVAAKVVSPDQLGAWAGAVGRVIKAPLDWLFDVAMLLVIRWAAMIYAVVEFVRGLIARYGHPLPTQQQEPGTPKQPFPSELYKDVQGADWTPYLKVGVVLAAAALVLLWLYRLERRRREAMGSEVEEERISLGFWTGLLADLRLWLRRRRMTPAPEAIAAAEAALAALDPHDPRALYRRLQSWGFGRGRGRKRSETPNQYAAALAEVEPEARAGAEAITVVYNQARYGPEPPLPEDVAAAAEALNQLQKPPAPRSIP